MNARGKLACIAFFCTAVAALAFVALPGPLVAETPVSGYEVVHAYPHDRFAFTEGLSYQNGEMFEGTGLNGNSTLRRVNITTGEVLQERQLPDQYFGEGLAVSGDRIVEITESSHTGFIYNATTFELVGSFTYPTGGWGIASDGTNLVMSDGTPVLRFLDPVTFRELRQVTVQDRGVPVWNLNELKYVKGEIWANIFPTNRIARISPGTGQVTGWINLSGLLSPQEQALIGWPEIAKLRGRTTIPFAEEACLNGIAYDPSGERIFVTGELWPELFEIRVVPV